MHDPRCKTCGAPVTLVPDGDPKYDNPAVYPLRTAKDYKKLEAELTEIKAGLPEVERYRKGIDKLFKSRDAYKGLARKYQDEVEDLKAELAECRASTRVFQQNMVSWKEACEKAEAELAKVKHCQNCGGSWVDDGIAADCMCIRIKELEAELAEAKEAVKKLLPRVYELRNNTRSSGNPFYRDIEDDIAFAENVLKG
jgi:hypothetical protein